MAVPRAPNNLRNAQKFSCFLYPDVATRPAT